MKALLGRLVWRRTWLSCKMSTTTIGILFRSTSSNNPWKYDMTISSQKSLSDPIHRSFTGVFSTNGNSSRGDDDDDAVDWQQDISSGHRHCAICPRQGRKRTQPIAQTSRTRLMGTVADAADSRFRWNEDKDEEAASRQLQIETDQLLQLLAVADSAEIMNDPNPHMVVGGGKNSQRPSLRTIKSISSQHVFSLLKAWMQLSAKGHHCNNNIGNNSNNSNSTNFTTGNTNIISKPDSPIPRGGIEAAHVARRLLLACERAAPVVATASTSTQQHNNLPLSTNETTLSWKPSVHFYNMVLHAYAVSGGRQAAAEAAEQLLEYMLCQGRTPLIEMNNNIPRGGSNKSCNEDRTLLLLKELDSIPKPQRQTFNIVMNCWAKACCFDSGMRAENIWARKYAWIYEQPAFLVSASRQTTAEELDDDDESRALTTVMDAWAKSGHPDAPERAWTWLRSILFAEHDQHQQQQQQRSLHNQQTHELSDAVPNKSAIMASPLQGNYYYFHRRHRPVINTPVLNAVLSTWVHSGRGRTAALQAEAMLQYLSTIMTETGGEIRDVVPNTRTYTLVLEAWARCEALERTGAAAARAEQILTTMIQLYHHGGAPNGMSSTSRNAIKPTAWAFTSCITAWSRCASSQPDLAPDRAQALWEKQIQLYNNNQGGDVHDLRPTKQAANALLSAWCRAVRRPDAMSRAHAVLQQLAQYGTPDLISYNTLLDGMAKRGLADDARQLLNWMEQQTWTTSEGTNVSPDSFSYNSVLAAIARCGVDNKHDGKNNIRMSRVTAETCELMLRDLEHRYQTTANSRIRPGKVAYTIVLDAWARSSHPDKGFRAKALVDTMMEQYRTGNRALKPDVYVFTTLIKACAQGPRGTSTSAKEQLLNLACQAMETLEANRADFGSANSMAYSTLMVAVNSLCSNSDQRKQHLRDLFDICCARGFVSHQVLTSLRIGGLLNPHSDNADAFRWQDGWSRNVPAQDAPRQRKK